MRLCVLNIEPKLFQQYWSPERHLFDLFHLKFPFGRKGYKGGKCPPRIITRIFSWLCSLEGASNLRSQGVCVLFLEFCTSSLFSPHPSVVQFSVQNRHWNFDIINTWPPARSLSQFLCPASFCPETCFQIEYTLCDRVSINHTFCSAPYWLEYFRSCLRWMRTMGDHFSAVGFFPELRSSSSLGVRLGKIHCLFSSSAHDFNEARNRPPVFVITAQGRG